MIRGSTPTHEFTVPFETKSIEKLEISYAQNDIVLFTKHKEDCILDGYTVTLSLTQEETLLFDAEKRYVQIQMRVKTGGEEVSISEIITVEIKKALFDEVI